MSIERQKSFISIARSMLTELGIIRESTSIRLESVCPYSDSGYDIGISVTIGEPDLFGRVQRETYVVRLDGEKEFVKMWRENK